MKCCNKRKELTHEEISEIFGVEWIDRDHGIYRVKPIIDRPEILDYRVYETTTPIRSLINDLKRTAVVRTKFFRLLYRPCQKEQEPRILFKLSPLYFENVKFHWAGLWFEGDIATRFENNSEEGKQGITWVRRKQMCPEDPEAYEWETVEGSASLFGNWLNQFWEDSTNTFISRLTQELRDRLDPRNYIDIKGYWKTNPLSLDTFMTMWSIFTTGTIVTRHGFDVTVSYNFNGEQTKTFHTDIRVRLPIRGDVSWFNL